ncbi:MAG TPA: hypothetical protein PKD64_17410 [Pirellulaceae bacterium]|nr:hypothetical protein [Pirellulaceae bacterium]HMO93966.1 hypothetical protein [Pirellulaceae bacterium]HMP70824.1 hypothetical protein [Pirellulaceae bacterium]
MSRNPIIVLKFGGSVIRSNDDLFLVSQEIYRWYREGYHVLAIVSAFYGRTDQLFREASQYPQATPQHIAKFVSCGELESAAKLGITLDQCGVPNIVYSESDIGLTTCGHPLDAEPLQLDADKILRTLQEIPIIVVPGFLGRDISGQVNLLGRGGSDFTALFIAEALGADRCRLIKDVDGLYEFDPQHSTTGTAPQRYLSITWDTALQLDSSILQPKAIRFAQERELEFEVSGLLSPSATVVGCLQNEFAAGPSVKPISLGLLGLGTVGQGVFEQVQRLPAHFHVKRVAVRNLDKHLRGQSLPPDHLSQLATADWSEAVDSDCEVIVELIGGLHDARLAIEKALERKKSVVTANKSLLASLPLSNSGPHDFHPTSLSSLQFPQRPDVALTQSATGNPCVLASAAVGGSVPALEFVRQIASRAAIKQIIGIINGTTNFVLDQIERGKSVQAAIALAQELGLAEADPSKDINGEDAAEKLCLICRAIGCPIELKKVLPQGEFLKTLTKLLEHHHQQRPHAKCPQIRQVLSVEFAQEPWPSTIERAAIELRLLNDDSAAENSAQTASTLISLGADDLRSLRKSRGASNLLIVETWNGQRFEFTGLGAGRWPTTLAVVADLIELVHEKARAASYLHPYGQVANADAPQRHSEAGVAVGL